MGELLRNGDELKSDFEQHKIYMENLMYRLNEQKQDIDSAKEVLDEISHDCK